jgi:hypothetical protein
LFFFSLSFFVLLLVLGLCVLGFLSHPSWLRRCGWHCRKRGGFRFVRFPGSEIFLSGWLASGLDLPLGSRRSGKGGFGRYLFCSGRPASERSKKETRVVGDIQQESAALWGWGSRRCCYGQRAVSCGLFGPGQQLGWER